MATAELAACRNCAPVGCARDDGGTRLPAQRSPQRTRLQKRQREQTDPASCDATHLVALSTAALRVFSDRREYPLACAALFATCDRATVNLSWSFLSAWKSIAIWLTGKR